MLTAEKELRYFTSVQVQNQGHKHSVNEAVNLGSDFTAPLGVALKFLQHTARMSLRPDLILTGKGWELMVLLKLTVP